MKLNYNVQEEFDTQFDYKSRKVFISIRAFFANVKMNLTTEK